MLFAAERADNSEFPHPARSIANGFCRNLWQLWIHWFSPLSTVSTVFYLSIEAEISKTVFLVKNVVFSHVLVEISVLTVLTVLVY